MALAHVSLMKIGDLDSLIIKLPDPPRFEGEDEYTTSVVLLTLVPDGEELNILFEKRAALIRQGNEISLPGGRRDNNDSSLQETAVRETNEELGIAPDKIRIVGRLDSIIAPMGALVHVFVGVADVEQGSIQANPMEVERAFMIPVTFFQSTPPEVYEVMTQVHPSYVDGVTKKEVILFPTRELGLPERYWNSWGGFRHKIYVYRTNEGAIWGITARIIRNFVAKL